MKQIKILVVLVVTLLLTQIGQGQQYYDSLRVQLDSLAEEYPGLDEQMDFGLSGVSIKEFMRSLAENHDLNISVDNNVGGTITNNFSNARVADVIVFIARENKLKVDFYGSILSFRYAPPKVVVKQRIPKVDYNSLNGFLTLDLKQDTIGKVAAEITEKSGANVLFAPELSEQLISAFIKNRPFENALELMAEANGLSVEKKSEQVFFLQKKKTEPKPENNRNSRNNPEVNKPNLPELDIQVDQNGLITANVHEAAINDVLARTAMVTGDRYFLYAKLEGNVSLFVDQVTFDEFVDYLLTGTDYTSLIEDGVFFIGKRDQEVLRSTELVTLEHRTIENVIDVIPSELKKGVTMKEFVELNGFVLSGSRPNIKEIKAFLAAIDQVVPVIKIDILIVDVSKSSSISAGIDLSLDGDNAPSTTSGTINPGIDMTLNSSSINNIIDGFNGLGLVNLGKVTSDFFANISALESNGVLRLRSTPMLATLNGHEANLKIGNTEYYLEVSNDIIGTQNPVQQQSQTYKSVNADLSLNIKPVVSSGNYVTLEIEVQQSDFTARISETAPPGTVDRNFKSYIRVSDGDMILLGGLEEKSVSDSGSGLPWISRVPVLKWLVSQRTKENSKSQLNIFIRPTVIY
tara:strand:- start:64 stop:1959 length:1896 start_codon:yes stop_codon:yes gene_type:complete